MRRYFALLFVLAVLATAGCVEEYTPETTVSPVQTTAATAAPAETPVPTPPPAEMAYLVNIRCAVGDRSEDAYHCNGDIRIRGGVYENVQVIARYPDNNTFRSNTVSLGGSDPVSRAFILFPDPRYQGQTPAYFVRMDGALYPVVWSGSTGIAWSNLPRAQEIGIS